MLIKIIEILLINSVEFKKLFPTGKPELGDMVKIIGRVRRIIEDILFDMFFESADEELHCLTKINESDYTIKTSISLTESFYQKHFGNLIPEEREKELNEFITRITDTLDEVNWQDVMN